MDNVKDDFYYAKRLLMSIERTSNYLKGKSMDDLMNDGYLCDAIENRFTKIAEDAEHLTKEFKESINVIPWHGIASIRNRVCHDYDVVDYSILYKTIKINFPQFRKVLLDAFGTVRMNLRSNPFELIKAKRKTIEMRLLDEKRKKLNIGDLIIFSNVETKEEIIAEVVNLNSYASFEELYANYKKSELGYKDNESANSSDMLEYYSKENILKYGVLAIEIRTY